MHEAAGGDAFMLIATLSYQPPLGINKYAKGLRAGEADLREGMKIGLWKIRADRQFRIGEWEKKPILSILPI